MHIDHTVPPDNSINVWDNTTSDITFSEANLDRAMREAQHDVDFGHEKEYWTEELDNPYGEPIRYEMWKTKYCGQPDCHHPLYSPMPI